MAADYGETVHLDSDETNFGEEFQPQKKDNKTIWIIVGVVAAIILCCCLVVILAGAWLYNNGDQIIEDLFGVYPLINLFLA